MTSGALKNCRLVPVLAVPLLAACHNTSNSAAYPGSSSASTAGDGGGRRGPGGRGEEMLLRGISLSIDQQQRIESIRARYRAQMEQMRQQSGGDRAGVVFVFSLRGFVFSHPLAYLAVSPALRR